MVKTTRWLVAFVVVALVSALGQPFAYAANGDALPYAKGFLVTGNYVASGVDLTEQNNPIDQNGFSTGTIHMTGPTAIPPDADIVAAYMYFETITLTSALSQATGVTFRGNTVLLNDLMAVKKSKQDLTGSTASCWSSGVPLTDTMFRVDVLRWLPIRLDADGKATGKRLVNDEDLLAHDLPLHQVKLPVRSGNSVPESAGASLVVVYRDPDPSKPLRKVVFYDGIHIQSSLTEVTTQSLQGFYRSSAQKSAQITHIIASGQPNKNERIFFDDGILDNGNLHQVSAADPIAGGSSSQRGWSTLTYDVSNWMNPRNKSAGGYGETASTSIDHAPGGGYDCLTLGAVIFSTAVADVDNDGLPDGLEDAAAGLKDPDGKALPNLNKMGPNNVGASSSHKDIFMEFNSLWAPAGTSYGGPGAPYDSKTETSTDLRGHNHTPTPEMLKLIGDAYVAHGITPHFDVGDITTYHASNPPNPLTDLIDPQKLGVVTHVDWVDDYTSTVADQYLVPSLYARGGEVIKEVACDRTIPRCQFPDFPGTVGWKFGLEAYRDQPVGDSGEEISLHPGDPNYVNWKTGKHRRRFDRERFGLFHYVLYAHARGNPKSDFPDNPDFHHPTTASGVADLPGGNVLVTLGLWDDFVGRPFVRASTTFHETGHNLGLWHGGFAAVWGNKYPLAGLPKTSTFIDLNCKPNYLSSMSYLYQVVGLFDTFDNIHLDYSDRDYFGSAFNTLNEKSALDDVEPSAIYIPAWFAPAGSPLAVALGASPSTRFCDGSKFGATPPAPMARVHAHATDNSLAIDWNGNPSTSAAADQNVNFDGTSDGSETLSSALRGFNDWANIRLDQIGAGRKAVKFQDGDFADFGSGDFTDFGSGDFTDFGSGDFTDYGSGDFTDFGSGDFTDFGSGLILINSSGDFVDFGSGDFTDFGSGDFTDFGSGDFLDFGTGSERQELDFDGARGLAKSAPYGLAACIVVAGLPDPGCTRAEPSTPQYHRVEVRFKSSTVGHVFQYVFQRKKGNAVSTDPYVPADGTPTASTTLSFIDQTELPDSQEFTYRVRTEFDDETDHTFSPWSQPVTITAVNDAPTAYNDTFSTNEDTLLTTGNVLGTVAGTPGFDTDDDSNHSGLRAVLVSGPSSGMLTSQGATLNVGDVFDGSFSFAPAQDFEGGPVSFRYKANDGTWPCPTNLDLNAVCQMSPDSDEATVTINVISRHTTTDISSSKNPSVYGDPLTFTATVKAVSPQLGTPTGTVTFNDGATTLGTGTLSQLIDGQATATFAISSLSATDHFITAEYAGDIKNRGTANTTGFYGSTSPPPPLTQTVDKADPTITVTGYAVPYDGNAHTATGTAIGVTGESLSGLDLSGTTHTAAGTYATDAWTFTDTTLNYKNASGTVSDAIGTAPSVTTVTCAAGPFTYNGAAQTPCSATVTGAGGLSLTPTPDYANNTDAGTATASYTYAGDANHTSSSDSKTFTIAKAAATISVTPYSVTYDGNAHTATGTAKGVKGESLSGLNLSGTTHTSVGDYPSDIWSFVGGTNYNNASGTVHDVIKAVYGFLNVANLPPPAGKTFKPGSAVPLKWQFTVDGVVYNSVNANPQITVVPPSGPSLIFTPQDPGSSSFQPPTAANGYTWQFNWQTKNANGTALPSGTYKVYVGSSQTGQTFGAGAFGPFSVTLK